MSKKARHISFQIWIFFHIPTKGQHTNFKAKVFRYKAWSDINPCGITTKHFTMTSFYWSYTCRGITQHNHCLLSRLKIKIINALSPPRRRKPEWRETGPWIRSWFKHAWNNRGVLKLAETDKNSFFKENSRFCVKISNGRQISGSQKFLGNWRQTFYEFQKLIIKVGRGTNHKDKKTSKLLSFKIFTKP